MILAPHLYLGEPSRQPAQPEEVKSNIQRTHICFHHQVADPGSSAFLALGSEIWIWDRVWKKPRSGKYNLDHISQSLLKVFEGKEQY
jgi:hypothetical protein